jgi:hypothetical protein
VSFRRNPTGSFLSCRPLSINGQVKGLEGKRIAVILGKDGRGIAKFVFFRRGEDSNANLREKSLSSYQLPRENRFPEGRGLPFKKSWEFGVGDNRSGWTPRVVRFPSTLPYKCRDTRLLDRSALVSPGIESARAVWEKPDRLSFLRVDRSGGPLVHAPRARLPPLRKPELFGGRGHARLKISRPPGSMPRIQRF